MKVLHAKHNRDACDAIIGLNLFPDWVVTTAFYSCIHYIDYKIFNASLKHDGRWFRNIDEVARYLKRGKHASREELVKIYHKSILSSYRFLSSNCETARYHNYTITSANAKKSREELEKIIEYCYPPDSIKVQATVPTPSK